MLKQKKYDWQDTNMALFGSDVEKNIKKASAESEDQWKGVGQKKELRIWRIEQFKVVPWPSAKYGQFHEGDSYIILNTYCPDPEENPDKLAWDAHFWIGEFSTQDEYGTAAYKTCELDHLLDDKAIQHREVQGHESKMFRRYFSRNLQILEGGTETGFTHVVPKEIPIRLFHVKGTKGNIVLKQVKLKRDNMNSGDVFILDTGKLIFQWNGAESNISEKRAAQTFCRSVESERGDCDVKTLDEGSDGDQDDENDEFWKHLPGKRKMLGITVGSIKVKEATDGGEDEEAKGFHTTLYRLSEGMGLTSGLFFSKILVTRRTEAAIPANYLSTNDVFILDTGLHLYVWVGKNASHKEKASGFTYAQKYLVTEKRPLIMPITRVAEGKENATFKAYIGPAEVKKGCIGGNCAIM